MKQSGFLAAGLVTPRLAGTNSALANTKRTDVNTREHNLGPSSDKMGKLRPRAARDPHKVTQQSWPELAGANSMSPPRAATDLRTSPCLFRASTLVLTRARKKGAQEGPRNLREDLASPGFQGSLTRLLVLLVEFLQHGASGSSTQQGDAQSSGVSSFSQRLPYSRPPRRPERCAVDGACALCALRLRTTAPTVLSAPGHGDNRDLGEWRRAEGEG